MALIACLKCGHKISSLARFCPKCKQGENRIGQTAPRLVALPPSGESIQKTELPPSGDNPNCTEMLQCIFKPSLDEMIVLEGGTFLVKSTFNVLDCYAYLTSKRYALCDSSGVNVILQVEINKIVFAEEQRHLLSKKIAVTAATGETFQVKSYPHITWYNALRDPKCFVDAAKKASGTTSNGQAGSVDWFYEVDGINVGPVKEKLIVQLIKNRHTVFSDTKVWNASLPEWKRAVDTILTIYFKEPVAIRHGSEQLLPGLQMDCRGFLPHMVYLFRKYF